MEKVARVKSQQETKKVSDTLKTSLPIQSSNKKSSTGKNFTLAPPPDKRFNLKKRSKTSIELTNPQSQHSTAISRPSTESKFSVASTASSMTVSNPRYRPGELPSYMRKNEKNITETMLNSRKKAFSLLRKRVQEYQTELVSNYKALNEMQQKFNQATGRDESIEEIKLITVMINEVEEMLIKNDDGTLKSAGSVSPLRFAKDSRKLDDIKDKLKSIGNSCDSFCQEFFTNLTKLPSELQATGDGIEPQSETQEILKSLEPTARKIRDQINIFKTTLGELESISSKACSLDPKLVKAYEEKLEHLVKLTEGKTKHTETAAIKDLKIQITDKQVILTEKDKEITQLKEAVKSLEDQKKLSDKEIQKITHEICVKSTALKKLENEIDIYKNRSKQNEIVVDEIAKQKTAIVEHVRKEQEAKNQYEKEHDLRLKLEKELIDRENTMEKLKLDLEQQKLYTKLGGGDRSMTESEHWAEVENLRAKLEKAIMEKSAIEKEKNELKKTLMINLRESQEKIHEIENLKCELSKALIEVKQQEETIYMHQRLLRIRSELINSLQEKEATNRCRMDDLYSEITKKTSLVNQMNHEISAKAEELQNLFSTLGTKQMELTRQEHIIKMLEENNDRSQRMRVKQEEKIARLENENCELKHFLKIANLKAAKL